MTNKETNTSIINLKKGEITADVTGGILDLNFSKHKTYTAPMLSYGEIDKHFFPDKYYEDHYTILKSEKSTQIDYDPNTSATIKSCLVTRESDITDVCDKSTQYENNDNIIGENDKPFLKTQSESRENVSTVINDSDKLSQNILKYENDKPFLKTQLESREIVPSVINVSDKSTQNNLKYEELEECEVFILKKPEIFLNVMSLLQDKSTQYEMQFDLLPVEKKEILPDLKHNDNQLCTKRPLITMRRPRKVQKISKHKHSKDKSSTQVMNDIYIQKKGGTKPLFTTTILRVSSISLQNKSIMKEDNSVMLDAESQIVNTESKPNAKKNKLYVIDFRSEDIDQAQKNSTYAIFEPDCGSFEIRMISISVDEVSRKNLMNFTDDPYIYLTWRFLGVKKETSPMKALQLVQFDNTIVYYNLLSQSVLQYNFENSIKIYCYLLKSDGKSLFVAEGDIDLSSTFSNPGVTEYKYIDIVGNGTHVVLYCTLRFYFQKHILPQGIYNKILESEEELDRTNLIVKIESLHLNKNCFILQDSGVSYIYIEYSFLGISGAELETKSKTKSHKIIFNHEKNFTKEVNTNNSVLKKLKELGKLNSQELLRFIVVSEPSQEQQEYKACKELGFAEVNLFTSMYLNNKNLIRRKLPVFSMDCKLELGTLIISVLGIDFMKEKIEA
uniref:RPGRIP1 C-terminal domain-containing protein n=1 Tax=Clastoptera arizonana TaxID=38151 RepID=A0A1B6DV46_9HEMI